MRIRQADMKEIVKRNEATLPNVATQKMIADILTKPLQGELFRALTSKVLGGGALDVTFQNNGKNGCKY